MGWVETRTAQDGKPRYIAKYRDLPGAQAVRGHLHHQAGGHSQRHTGFICGPDMLPDGMEEDRS